MNLVFHTLRAAVPTQGCSGVAPAASQPCLNVASPWARPVPPVVRAALQRAGLSWPTRKGSCVWAGRRTRLAAPVVLALAAAVLLLSRARLAAEEAGTFFGAHLLQPKISTAPAAAGSIDLTCTVGLLGGCCFPLTSHNVTAALTVPAGVTVLSGPEPASYPAIQAPVSGTPQAWATFRWRLKRADPQAEVPLAITVASTDSGEVKAAYTLGQQATCSVTGPDLPEVLPPAEGVPLAVDANCLDEERFVKSVCFWYTTDIPAEAEAVEAPQDLGGRGILRFTVGGRQLMVQAQALDLARKYEPTTWYGKLPVLPAGTLYGIAVATDDTGRISCGPVVHRRGPVTATASAAPVAPADTAPAAAAPMSANPARLWVLAGICLASSLLMLLARRQGPAVLLGLAAAEAAALVVAWFALAPAPSPAPGAASAEPQAGGYPPDGSVVVYLFLDGGAASRQLAERIEGYRRAAPHRIHVLCFVDGVTPAPLLASLRERYHVTQTPGVVFDAYLTGDTSNPGAVDGTLDRCFNKAPPHLSMEMHGGVIAGRQLSLGFIMCNHGSHTDARGSTAMFAFEDAVQVADWQCDHVVRAQVAESRPFLIPTGKCQPPAMLKWDIPTGVDPKRVGALTVVLDEQGHAVDSICTEKPCTRTGVCG
jgi:hypothetical protein